MNERVTEAEFQAQIIDTIQKIHGDRALIFHDHDSRRNESGFPDIIAIVPNLEKGEEGTTRILAWEIKRQKDKTPKERRESQASWVEAFGTVTQIDARLVRPDDWDEARRYV